MSWLAAQGIRKAAPFVLAGLLGLVIWFLWSSNQKLNVELGKLRTELNLAISVNEENLVSISTLGGMLDSCNEQFTQSMENNRLALAKLSSEYEALKKQKDRVHVELREIFKSPSCEELGNIDLHNTCPALSAELRLLADGIDQN